MINIRKLWKIYSISCFRDKNNFSPWEGMKNVSLNEEKLAVKMFTKWKLRKWTE